MKWATLFQQVLQTTIITQQGYLQPSNGEGCLVDNGMWSHTDCAMFYLTQSRFGGVTLATDNGPCNVIRGQLACTHSTTPGFFTHKDGTIDHVKQPEWSADVPPSPFAPRVPIQPGKQGVIRFNLDFARARPSA